MARQLILLRHGDIGEEYRGRYIGSTDVALSIEGRRQIQKLAKIVGAKNPVQCLTSPQLRCRETVEIISGLTGLHFETDSELREISFGAWEGLTFAEIAEASPALVRQWTAFAEGFTFPQGEAIADFLSRIEHIAKRISAVTGDTMLICTHGGVIRSLICHFLGLPPRQYVLFGVKTASLTTIELFDGKGVLAGLNETN